MAEPHLDHPGRMHWFMGHGPAPVLGPCTHACQHLGDSVVAWGPSHDRYELVECGTEDSTCRCRAWSDGRGVITTQWLQVDHTRERPRTDREEQPSDV